MSTPAVALFMLSTEAEQQQEAADMAKCNRQGFVAETSAMATCLSTSSREREAERNRLAAQRRAEQQAAKARAQLAPVTSSTEGLSRDHR